MWYSAMTGSSSLNGMDICVVEAKILALCERRDEFIFPSQFSQRHHTCQRHTCLCRIAAPCRRSANISRGSVTVHDSSDSLVRIFPRLHSLVLWKLKNFTFYIFFHVFNHFHLPESFMSEQAIVIFCCEIFPSDEKPAEMISWNPHNKWKKTECEKTRKIVKNLIQLWENSRTWTSSTRIDMNKSVRVTTEKSLPIWGVFSYSGVIIHLMW